MILRRLSCAFIITLLTAGGANAETPPALNNQAQGMLGSWEFSNADRDKLCMVAFKSAPAHDGYALEFEPRCAMLFPFVREIVAWKYPEDDLLYLLDAKGKALVEFSEVEDGIFEAPTPGVGVLFLQNAAAAPPPRKSPEQIAGNWILKGSDGAALCPLTLATTPAAEGFALAVGPGCDKTIAQLDFAQWRLDREELVLQPAHGNAWRFEALDEVTWGRLPESVDRVTLVRR